MTVSFVPELDFVMYKDGELIAQIQKYIPACITIIGTILGMFIRTDGKPQVCMLVSILGCILNGILDYIFVDIMTLGIQGSAVASLIVQLLTVVAQMFYFISQKSGIIFRKFVFDKKINREIVFNGSSEFIGEMASAISMFVYNFVLMKYVGAEGVAAFTILGFVVYGYSMICRMSGAGLLKSMNI